MTRPHVHSPSYYCCEECETPASTDAIHHLPGGPLCRVCYARYRAAIARVFDTPRRGEPV